MSRLNVFELKITEKTVFGKSIVSHPVIFKKQLEQKIKGLRDYLMENCEGITIKNLNDVSVALEKYFNFEERHSDSIICPYCKWEGGDMWEHSEQEDIFECPDCGKKFNWRRDTSVEYITTCNCEDNNETHDYNEPDDWMTHKEENYDFKICSCKKCSEYKVKKREKNDEN